MSEPTSKKSKKTESKYKDSEAKDKVQKRPVGRLPRDKSQIRDPKKISKEDSKSLKSQKHSSHNRQSTSKNADKNGSDDKKLRQKSEEIFNKDAKLNSISDKLGPIPKRGNKLSRAMSQSLEIGNPSGSENESESSTQESQSYEYEDFSTSEEAVGEDVDKLRKSSLDSFFESIKDSSPNHFQYQKMPNEVELISAHKKSSETLSPEFFFSQQPEDSGYKLTTFVNDDKLLKNIDDMLIVTDSINIDVFDLEQNTNYNLSSNEDPQEFKSLPPQMQTSLHVLQDCFSGISSIVKGLVDASGRLYKPGPDDFRFENEFQDIEKGYGKYNNDKSFRQFVEQDFVDQIKSILDV